MGTRAAFFINDARDLKKRICLGYIHMDGYPEGVERIFEANDEDEFRYIIKKNFSNEAIWTDGSEKFPYPWPDDLYLTDFVYSFIPEEGVIRFNYGYPTKYHVTRQEYDMLNTISEILYERYSDEEAEQKLDYIEKILLGEPETETFENIPAPRSELNV